MKSWMKAIFVVCTADHKSVENNMPNQYVYHIKRGTINISKNIWASQDGNVKKKGLKTQTEKRSAEK